MKFDPYRTFIFIKNFAPSSKRIVKVPVFSIIKITTVKHMKEFISLVPVAFLICFCSSNLTACTPAERAEHLAPNYSLSEDIFTLPNVESHSLEETVFFSEFLTDAPWENKPVLDYDERWEFTIEETPTDDLSVFPRGVSSCLVASDKLSGNTQILTEPFSTNISGYRLYPFSNILNKNGFVLEYSLGVTSVPKQFFCVDGSEIKLFASCDGAIYTSDFDGDGVKELTYSTYEAFPSTFVYFLDKYGTPVSISLDDVAKDTLSQTDRKSVV